MTTPRILFYCQPLVGSGHLMRSLYICKALVQAFEIDFVYGGKAPAPPIHSPRFHLLQLAPAWSSKSMHEIEDATGTLPFESLLEKRKEQLHILKERHYSAVITEMYPFSKLVFEKEIQGLIDGAKKNNSACKILCSFKGMHNPMTLPQEQILLHYLESYDAVLSHADPRIMPFEDFFSLTSALGHKLHYTGFVTDPAPLSFVERKKQILVTFGAGAYGQELPKAVLAIAPLFKEYRFLFVVGPRVPEELKVLLKNNQNSFIQVTDFIADFYPALQASTLCITLGGATLVDTIKTQTPTLVYPDSTMEHLYRAFKFSKRNAVHIVHKGELSPTRLASIVQKVLQTPYTTPDIDITGAETTLGILKEILPPDDEIQDNRKGHPT